MSPASPARSCPPPDPHQASLPDRSPQRIDKYSACLASVHNYKNERTLRSQAFPGAGTQEVRFERVAGWSAEKCPCPVLGRKWRGSGDFLVAGFLLLVL